jgi:hypothetical protein
MRSTAGIAAPHVSTILKFRYLLWERDPKAQHVNRGNPQYVGMKAHLDPDEWQEAYSWPAARGANTAGSKVLTEILQTNECDT